MGIQSPNAPKVRWQPGYASIDVILHLDGIYFDPLGGASAMGDEGG